MNRTLRIATPLLCGSGLCALVYQIVWTRELRFVFGASTAASSAVIAIFIAGLGFGGLWFGKRVERSSNPLAFYAQLELAIAAFCAATPLLLGLVRAVYSWSGGSLRSGEVGSTALRLALSTLVLGPATFLMGGTLPAIARFVETARDVARRAVAWVYAVNTLGAVGGCLLSTFVLLEAWGARATLYTAVVLNASIALLARRASRRPIPPGDEGGLTAPARRSQRPGKGRSRSSQAPATEASGAAEAPRALVYASAAIVGFVFFLMELVWYRVLGPLLGGTVFTFGLILAIALSGIGLGSALYAVVLASRRFMLLGFALTCALEAVSIALPFALGDRIAIWTILLRPVGPHGLADLVYGWSAIAGLVVFPAALVSGVQFPLLIALLGSGREHVGRDVGAAYASNTLGAISGALAGGFGLLPALGALGCWRLASLLLAAWAAGIAALALARAAVQLRAAGVLAIAALATALSFAQGPTAAWRHSPIGAGRVSRDDVRTPNLAQEFMRTQRRAIDWETDGIESSVAIDRATGLAFIVNGKSDGNAREDAATQVMSGMLGAALLPKVERAMVIGLGTGSTAGWLAKLPEIQRVDVAEIEPVIAHVARLCASVNQRALDNPKLRVQYADAREVLASSGDRYDLIFSEPSNPYRAGITSLYTREFYAAISRRLTERGVFVQWMQTYDIDDETMRSIYATLAAVFPHVETWDGMRNDLLLVGSQRELVHDTNLLRARIEREPIASALRLAWLTDDLRGFLGHYVANEAFTRAMAESSRALNTDDRAPVEFGFARNLRGSRDDGGPTLLGARAHDQHRPAVRGPQVDWQGVDWEREAFTYLTTGRAHPELLDMKYRGRLEALSRWANADFQGAFQRWSTDGVPAESATRIERLMLAELIAQQGDGGSDSELARLTRDQPVLGSALRAVWLSRYGRRAEASSLLLAALEQYRVDPWAPQIPMARAMHTVMQLREPSDAAFAQPWLAALARPFAVFVNDLARENLEVEIAWTLGAANQACVDVLAKFEPNADWTERMLEFRAACYAAHAHPLRTRAQKDLEQYRANEAAARE